MPIGHLYAGERFGIRRAANSRAVDCRQYRLKAPAGGARYVRSGRDIVLVDDRGTVRTVHPDRFR